MHYIAEERVGFDDHTHVGLEYNSAGRRRYSMEIIEAGNDLIMPEVRKMMRISGRRSSADGRLSEKKNPSLCREKRLFH